MIIIFFVVHSTGKGAGTRAGIPADLESAGGGVPPPPPCLGVGGWRGTPYEFDIKKGLKKPKIFSNSLR